MTKHRGQTNSFRCAYHAWTYDIDGRLKAVMDNFSELYHVDFLDPQHKRMVDCCNDTLHLLQHGHTGLSVPGGTVNPRFPIPNEPTNLQSMQLKSLGLDPSDFHGRVMDVRIAIQKSKREVGAEMGMHYESFNEDQLSDVWQYNLYSQYDFVFYPRALLGVEAPAAPH